MLRKAVLICLMACAVAYSFAWDKTQEKNLISLLGVDMLSYKSESAVKAAMDRELENKLTPDLAVLRRGILMHNLSLIGSGKGDTGNAKKAVQTLEEGLNSPGMSEEEQAFFRVYQGSAQGLQALEETNPFTKISCVKKSFAILDDLVEKYGDTIFLPRFLRSQVAKATPAFLKKMHYYQEDLEALETLARTNPEFEVPPQVLSDIYNQLGTIYKDEKRTPDAIRCWKRAVELDPAMQYGGKHAREALDIFGN